MNGQELERLLSRIDQNLNENEAHFRSEVMAYLQSHQDAVVLQLRDSGAVRIPTSFGNFDLQLSDLRNNILRPIAA